MRKKRYFIANFFKCTKENRLATSACQLLEAIDCISQTFRTYADKSDGQLPRFVLHNMIQNNKILDPELPEIFPYASTSCQRQSSQERLSFRTEKSNSLIPRKQLKIYDEKNEDIAFESKMDKITDFDNKEFERLFGITDESESLAEDGEIDVFTDDGMEINPKEGSELNEESEKCIIVMMRENLVQIRSITIIKESEGIGVEIEVCKQDEISSEEPEKDSGPSGNTNNSPDIVRRNTNLPFSFSSKHMKSFPFDSLLTVDYSNPNILYFLAQRLLSILFHRNMFMKQIHNHFESFLNFVSDFNSTIKKLKMLVREFPMAKEQKFFDELKQIHDNLIIEAWKMSEKVRPLIEDVIKDIAIWKNSLVKIENFAREKGQLLSTNNETILTICDLKNLEFRLNEICRQADETLIPQDQRRVILLNLSVDFEWLAKQFVKFLIFTGILIPPPFYVFGNSNEK